MAENDEKLAGKHRKAFFKLYNFLAENDFSFVLHFPLFRNLRDLNGAELAAESNWLQFGESVKAFWKS